MNLSVDLNKVQNKGHYLGLDLKKLDSEYWMDTISHSI